MTTERDDLTIWGAVGPNGQLVKSSVGTFKSVAARWALRRGNYEVVKLGTVPSPGKVVDDEGKEVAPELKAKAAPAREEIRREPKDRVRSIPSHRRREEPEEADMELVSADTPSHPPEEKVSVPDKFKIDRTFFGRRRKRNKK